MSLRPNSYSYKMEKLNMAFHKKKITIGFGNKANQFLNKPPLKPKKKSRKEKEQLSSIEAVVKHITRGPAKFLNPIHTYDILGFFFMYEKGFDYNESKGLNSIGLFEVTNFYRKINRIERVNNNLTTIFCEDINTPIVPFPLIISRLMSLSNNEAYTLAETIKSFFDSQEVVLKALESEMTEDQANQVVSLADVNLLRNKHNTNFLLHDIAIDEMKIDSQSPQVWLNLNESFINELELQSYEAFLQRNESFMKKNEDQSIYIVRYKAKAGSNTYNTMQHFYTKMYGKMICPEETYYLTSLFREGFPNPVKCSENYFNCINQYLRKLLLEFNEEKINFIEKETTTFGKEDDKMFTLETMDGLQMPVKIKISIEIFKGKRFMEVVKRTQFIVSEENQRYLLSDERKKNFIINYKMKRQADFGNNDKEKNFISRFYPGVIPKNEISFNQSKICQYREISLV